MTLDAEFNVQKNEVEKAELNIGYNKKDNSIKIGTVNVSNYNIIVSLPQSTTEEVPVIVKRAEEVGNAVKKYFVIHPDKLKGIGSSVHLALVNATGSAIADNITFITTGTGSIVL